MSRPFLSPLVCSLILTLSLRTAGQAQPLTPRSDHPRLFFTAEKIEALKVRIAGEKSSADAWNGILAAANEAVAHPANAGRVARGARAGVSNDG